MADVPGHATLHFNNQCKHRTRVPIGSGGSLCLSIFYGKLPIAEVITRHKIDILALQEIGTTGGATTKGMLDPILARLGKSYSANISLPIGSGYKGTEVSALIFRNDVVSLVDDFELDAYECLLDDVSEEIYSYFAKLADTKSVRIRKHGVCTFNYIHNAAPDTPAKIFRVLTCIRMSGLHVYSSSI